MLIKTEIDLFKELEKITTKLLFASIKDNYNHVDISDFNLETPVDSSKDVVKVGFFAMPVFFLVKQLKRNPNEVAKEISNKLNELIENSNVKINNVFIKDLLHSQSVAQYVNIYINEQNCANIILKDIIHDTFSYLKLKPNGKTVVMDLSSPNIAKPFGIGHLRSTIIGNSIFKILRHQGYKVIRVNHLGDWGTQFGKILAAYELFGNKDELMKDPVEYLFKLYVKYNKLEEKDEKYKEKARQYFQRLENNDPKSLELWELFRELSLEHFKKIYDMIYIDFDYYSGESYYVNHTDHALNLIKEKGLLFEDDGAQLINLEEFNLGKVIVIKSNGTSTYFLRDVAAALYRINELKGKKLLYVVGNEQKLYFQQVFKVMELLGYNPNIFEHVGFGFLSSSEGKYSTRKGNILKFEDVFDKTMKLVDQKISQKIKDDSLKNLIVKNVAISSLFYSDLSNDRVKDVTFNWSKILDFEGDTGPYILYTIVRANSILDKSEITDAQINKFLKNTILISTDIEKRLITHILRFRKVMDLCEATNKPHHLARFAMDLSKRYNDFYHSCQVIGQEHNLMHSRIVLTLATKYLLELSIRMLGIKPVKNM